MEEKKYYAHSRKDLPKEKWHRLEDHLKSTAELAAKFAKPFGVEDLAKVVGLFHDLGKSSLFFQDYLDAGVEGKPHGKMRHAIWGAALAYWWLGRQKTVGWEEIALPILGHHAGLVSRGKAATDINTFATSAEGGQAIRMKDEKPS